MSDEEIFRFLDSYYEFVGDTVASGKGRVVKFMGDASFMVFPETHADDGVRTLLTLHDEGNKLLAKLGFGCRHHIRAHFGPAWHGELGARGEKRFDVVGSTVNTMFLLKTSVFAITPEAFRKLNGETRKLFKKHSLPVAYIPMSHPHK